MQYKLYFAIGIIFSISGFTESLSKTKEKEIKDDIVQLIEINVNPKGELHFIAGFVRVAFHDCVGGCDGCLNLRDSNNAGLDVYVEPLETVYAKYNTDLTRADFWQLVGITAIERSARNCRACIRPKLVFETGRKDCADSPDYKGLRTFPMGGGHADINSGMIFLENAFGLPRTDPKLATALIGAHSLGESHASASGWNGRWTQNPDQITNRYYKNLIKLRWSQIDLNKGKPGVDPIYQWQPGKFHSKKQNIFDKRKKGVMMLNADLAFAKNLSTDATGLSGCPVSSKCKDQPDTAEWVRKYADNATLWEENFAIAYMMMIRTGYNATDLHATTAP
ncbi:unnamed protein product [Owenia fusiformis]|uniref:Uncharacterized protein n=1 Tax=Owenia fusiformis TaxID=6347 RepID=A0A8J1U0Q2_OWEFU|nr:unnamed protein product [Owenia fusiformis]